ARVPLLPATQGLARRAGRRRLGTGPKDFIKRLRRGEYFTIDNLYNDALEPLFYEALAKPEGSPTYRAVGLRFPFLNGGLFEAYRGYDWRRLRLPIPNATLEAVLDTLDTYNFTVREDHPLEQEVAVDPEMLGRVFERLLDVRERKHKGAHYTRREI